MFKRKVGELAQKPHIIAAGASVAQAADRMVRDGVNCLAAIGSGKVVGFLTEHELAHHLDVDIEPTTAIRDLLLRPGGAIAKDMPVPEAVKILLERGLLHLPVVDAHGALLGLVTDKELVDALAVDFMVENAVAGQLMRPDVGTVTPQQSVRDVLRYMRAQNTDCVVAVEAGKPVGIFSERDSLARILPNPERLTQPVSSHMSTPVVSVPTSAMVYKVIQYMRQRNVRRVAVLNDYGVLAGLLSQRDILTYARRSGM